LVKSQLPAKNGVTGKLMTVGDSIAIFSISLLPF